MKQRIVPFFVLFLIINLVLLSCGGSSGSDDPVDDDPDPVQLLPEKASALIPANGEPCSEFEEVSGQADKALIFFQWRNAPNTSSYRISVLENGSQVATENLNTTQTEIVLDRGKTYTWTVTAINSDGETISDTFSFTSPGVAIGNYAPYAAEISVEFDTMNMEMDISWVGSDEDGDPLTYDVEVLQEGVGIELFTELSTESLDPLAFIPGDNYEISVTSRDDAGNFSVSVLQIQAPE